jgi:hypothetical protein
MMMIPPGGGTGSASKEHNPRDVIIIDEDLDF